MYLIRKGHTEQRPNSGTKFRQKSKEFSSLLFTVTYFYFFKLTQPLTKEKGKPDRKPYPHPYGFRNPYRILKSENSQDYAQKPQRNGAFMNSTSGHLKD